MSLRFLALALVTLFTAQVRVDVRLVNVVATVTDDRGRHVSGLSADDFILEEDGLPQKISHFSRDQEVPISVGIMLDTSGSMERKIGTAIEAVDRFIRRVHANDEIFLTTFSSEPILRQDFTSDRNKLSQALRKIHVSGGTALYDAIAGGLEKVRSGRHDKRAVLVITDGQDTSSIAKLDMVLRTVRESDLLVYSLGISPFAYAQRKRDKVDMKVLRQFADSSGGRAFLLTEGLMDGRGSAMETVLGAVADELHSQYTLGYYPSHPDDGRYHAIRIRTKSGYAVRARTGYFAAN